MGMKPVMMRTMTKTTISEGRTSTSCLCKTKLNVEREEKEGWVKLGDVRQYTVRTSYLGLKWEWATKFRC